MSSAQTADVPALISFQGRLTDGLANPLAGPHDFVFAIYAQSSGGTALWSETRNAVPVTNGALNLQLGAATPIPASVFELDAAYLQITVDGSPLSPRERLVTVPYAFHSRLLQGRAYDAFVSTDAAAQTIAGAKTFSRQLTVSSDVYISAGQLNVQGNRLTTAGGLLDAGKLSGTITASQVAAAGVQPGALAAGVTITPGGVDLSTVSAALAGRLDKAGDFMSGQLTTESTVTVKGGEFSVAGATLTVAAGRVGVGTASPAGRLEVVSDQTAGTNQVVARFRLTSGGSNVDIVNNDGSGNTAVISEAVYGATDNSAASLVLGGTDANAASHRVDVNRDYTDVGRLNGTSFLRVDNSGNVGIGTSGPAAKLDVAGSAQFGSGASKSTFSAAGALTFPAGYSPANPLEAATKGYVDSAVSGSSGWTESGAVVRLSDAADNVVVQSTLTVQGNAFSVGGSTLAVLGGNVGIGTTAPGSLLHIHGALAQVWGSGLQLTREGGGDARINVINNGMMLRDFTGGTTAFDFRNSADSSMLTVLSNGNTGVGSTLPATKLDVSGDAQFGSGAAKSTFSASGVLTFPTGYSPANPLEAATKGYVDSAVSGSSGWTESGAVVRLSDAADNVVVQSTLTVQGNAFSVGGSTLSVSYGNVGIGTTSPGAKLALSGTGSANGVVLGGELTGPVNLYRSADNVLKTDDDLDVNDEIRIAGITSLTRVGGRMDLASDSNYNGGIVFYQSGSEKARLDPSGSLGLGTAAPGARLHVSSGTLLVDGNAAAPFRVGASSLVLTSEGRLGLGTAAPDNFLHINDPSGTAARIKLTGTAQTLLLGTGYLQAGAVPGVLTETSTDLGLGTNNAERVRITSAGDVGIGTTAPGTKLDVAGAAQFGSGASKSTFSATGVLTFPTGYSPADPLEAATKGYVDSAGGGWTDAGAFLRPSNANDSVVVPSTLTVQGNAFSIGGSTLVVAGGKVGIGTASPAHPLHVNGNIQVGTAGNLARIYFADSAGTTKSFITQAAVGNADVNDLRLNTNSHIRLSDDNENTGADIRVNGYGDQAEKIAWQIPAVNAASGVQIPFDIQETISQSGSAGYTAFRVNPTETATGSGPRRIVDFQAGGTSRFLVEPGGNVGIGTTLPATKLDVAGDAQFGSGASKSTFSATGVLTFPTGYSPANPLEAATKGYVDSAGGGWSDAGAFLRPADANDNVVVQSTLTVQGNAFSVGTSTLVVAAGAVGMGTTAPASRLHVSTGAAGSVDLLTLEQTDGTINNQAGILFREGPGVMLGRIAAVNQNPGADRSQLKFYTNASGTQVTNLSLQFDGSAGIGVEDPQAKLEIGGNNAQIYLSGSADANRLIANNAGTAYMGLKVYGTPGVVSKLGLGHAPNISTQVADVLTVTSAGDAGVGTTAPSATLHVSSAATSATTPLLIVSSGTGTGQELVRVQKDGKVGVGTSAPARSLEVAASGADHGYARVSGGSGGGGAYLELKKGTAGNDHRLDFLNQAGGWLGGLGMNPSGHFVFYDSSFNVPLFINTATRNVGVNDTNAYSTMTVGGAVGFTGIKEPSGPAAGRGILYFDSAASKFRASENGGAFVDLVAGPTAAGWTESGAVVRLSDAADNVVVQSTLTVQGAAFSVASDTLAVAGGFVGVGTSAPAYRLHVSENRVGEALRAANANANGDGIYATGTRDGVRGYTTGSGVGVRAVADGNGTALAATIAANRNATGVSINSVGASASAKNLLEIIHDNSALSGDAVKVDVVSAGNGSFTGKLLNLQRTGSSLVVVDSAGNAGIGTGSPAALLHVSSANAVAASTPLLVSSGTGTGQELFVVKGDGKVGLGTASPSKRLHVTGAGDGDSGVMVSRAGGGSGFIEMSAGDELNLQTLGHAYPLRIGNNWAYFTTTGRQGVGTASPATKLDVSGDAQFGSGAAKSTFSATGVLTFPTGYSPANPLEAATKGYVDGALPAASGWTESGAVVRLTDSADNVVVQSTLTVQGNAFSVGGSTLVVSSGRLGVGTNAPGNRLQIVGGPTALSDFIRLSPDGSAGAQGVGIGIQIEAQPTAQTTSFAAGRIYGLFDANGFGSERLTLQSPIGGVLTDTLSLKGGRVGIDTTAPATDLQVGAHDSSLAGSYVVGNSPVLFQSLSGNGGSTPAAGEPALVLARAGVAGQSYSNYAALELKRYENVGTNSRTQLDIRLTHAAPEATPAAIVSMRSDGSVGVGTSNPAAKLHLSSGTLLVDGDAATAFKVGASSLVVTSDARLGIGASAPAARLHVAGGIGEGPEIARFDFGDDSYQYLQLRKTVGTTERWNFGFTSGLPHLTFVQGAADGTGTERMRLTTAGNLGLGVDAAQARLDVRPAAGSEYALRVSSPDASAILSVAKTGYLGVGTFAPSARFHLRETGSAAYARAQGGSDGDNYAAWELWSDDGTPVKWQLAHKAGSGVTYDFHIEHFNGASWSTPLAVRTGGNVGVGTTAPQSRVHVLDGDIRVSTSSGQGSRGIIFQDGSVQTTAAGSSLWAANVNDVYLNASDQVGIGISAPTNSLHIYDHSGAAGRANFLVEASAENAYVNMQADAYTANPTATIVKQGSTGLLKINNVGSSSDNHLVIDNQGRVGVGTSAQSARLHVSSAAAAASDTVLLVSTGTGSAEKLLAVMGDGKVGVGNASPAADLDVDRGNPANAWIRLGGEGATASKYVGLESGGSGFGAGSGFSGVEFGPPSGTGEGYLAFHTHDVGVDSGERMRIDKSGNVGIGTTSPSAKLHVGNGSTTNAGIGAIFLQSGNGAGGARDWKLYSVGTGNFGIRDMGFNNAGGGMASDALTIEYNTGNVGIGTTGPVDKLEVAGDVRITGTGFNNPSLYLPSAQQHIRIADRGVLQGWPAEGLSGTRFAHNLEHQSGVGDVRIEAGGAGKYEVQSGTLTFHTFPAAPAGTVTAASANERMRIDASGNVGIGTTGPQGILDIKGFNGSYSYARFNPSLGTGGTAHGFRLSGYGSNGAVAEVGYIDFETTNGTTGSESGILAFGTRNAGTLSQKMTLTSDGQLGIGGTNASAKLYANGNIFAQNQVYDLTSNPQGGASLCRNGTNGAHSECSSDRRLKKNIADIAAPALPSVMKLRPVEFDWKNGAGPRQAGFIAQDVRALFPLTVGGDEGKGRLTFAPGNLVPYLTKALQEQQAQIEELKARLEALERGGSGR